MRYNRTNFSTPQFAQKLLHAMHEAITQGFNAYIEDRNGQRWLRVAIIMEGGRYSFQFIARNGQDVGSHILESLFSWTVEDEREFLTVVQKLYSMTEHPLILARRAAVEAELEDRVVGQLGATHKVYEAGSGRFVGYGRYDRKLTSWFRKRLVLVTDAHRRAYGVPLLCDESVVYTEPLPGFEEAANEALRPWREAFV